MILVDTALQQRAAENNPIRVGVIGAGFMARGVILQMLRYVPGFRVVAVANRTLEKAQQAYELGGQANAKVVETQSAFDAAAEYGTPLVTQDPLLISRSPHIDVIVDITGSIEYAAQVVLEAIQYKKHIVLMNPELDGTIGPILKHYAAQAGVIFTNVEGDQPGVIMNLYRFVKGMGIRPVLCGNIKGLHDPYRNPTTQAAFAKQWGQQPHMVTSFADGSKISFEQAIVANGTGMGVGKRGMFGPTVEPGSAITKTVDSFPLEALLEGNGIVDYVVGAAPNSGVFVLGTHDDPVQKHYLNLYKVGEGPLYCFYNPYHLCHFEVHNTVARAVLFNDAALTPLGKPYVDVVATAKRDLTQGETIDGIGHYMTYGLCENHAAARAENLLPIGLAEGCVVKRNITKDTVLTFDDVTLPTGRLSDTLWNEQLQVFG